MKGWVQKKCSDQTLIDKAPIAPACQDDVVIDLDPQETACLDKLPGDSDVFLAGSRVSAWMVVNQDDPGCRFEKGFPEDVPGMNDTGVKGPFGDRNLLDEPVSPIQK